ncbi:MAG: hypothetical protein WBV69_15195, partial [Candidatus Sulfotelmatobacter sp.]
FKVVNRNPIPATVLDTNLPAGLDYIIARAMAKDPGQRYQRGAEMASDIKDLQEGRLDVLGKAKEAESATAGVAQPSSEQPVSPLPVPAQPTERAQSGSHESFQGTNAAQNLLGVLRSRAFSAAVLSIGLLIFAFRISPLIFPKRSQSALKSSIAAGLTPASDSAVPNTIKVPSAPSTSHATAGGAPRKLAKESAKPSIRTIHPVLTKVKLSETKPVPDPAADVKPAPDPVVLGIEVQHKFEEAQLSVWVDGRLSFTHSLEGTDKTRLGVFHRVQGHEFHAMQLPPGSHELRVGVTANSLEKSATITGDFESSGEKTLKVSFDKHGEMNLHLD